jgi:hypothetical protein
MRLQEAQAPHGLSPDSQFKACARLIASVILPTWAGPTKR